MSDLIRSFQNPVVRDLVWAITSPPLVSPRSTVHWPSADWYSACFRNVEENLRRLDHEPAPLLAKISEKKAQRLGFYFETLIEAWCELEAAIEVIATNPQISRLDGSTLGAFDLLLRVNGAVEHWECAVKFYLGEAHGADRSLWYGPNRQDRLDLKLGHMHRTQLTLSNSDEGKAWLATSGFEVDRVRSIVKGRVFYPQGSPITPPDDATPEHSRAEWLTWSAFEASFRERGEWLQLPRRSWLAPRRRGELDGAPPAKNEGRPVQLTRCDDADWEAERVFVVPDDWGNEAG